MESRAWGVNITPEYDLEQQHQIFPGIQFLTRQESFLLFCLCSPLWVKMNHLETCFQKVVVCEREWCLSHTSSIIIHWVHHLNFILQFTFECRCTHLFVLYNTCTVTENRKHVRDNIRRARWKHFKGVYCSLRGRRRWLITTAISYFPSFISHFLITGRRFQPLRIKPMSPLTILSNQRLKLNLLAIAELGKPSWV